MTLGRLPEALIGGGLELDAGAARAAYEELGRKLDIAAEEAAAGVLEIASANQVHGIRRVTTTRGVDPSDYAMVAFGGAGGLFAAEVSDFLGIATAVVPPNPGNLSAFGLHVSDVKRDYVRTCVRQQSSHDADELEALWSSLEEAGRSEIEAEGVAREAIDLVRSADVRYVGEGHEVPVPISPGTTGFDAVETMWRDFHKVHESTFGFHYEGRQDVEVVSLRVQAVGRVHRPEIRPLDPDGGEAAPVASRRVYWRANGWIECGIWRRGDLGVGESVAGPAIVEEYGSTTVVPETWRLTVDRYGNLILEKSS